MIVDDATRIRIIRALVGMESSVFARTMGVSAGTVTAWEKGRTTPHKEKRNELALFCQKNSIAFTPSGMPIPFSDLILMKEN